MCLLYEKLLEKKMNSFRITIAFDFAFPFGQRTLFPRRLDIGHVSHNPEEMKAVYDIGRKTAEQQLEQIKRFLEG